VLTLLAVAAATACHPDGETPGLWLRGDSDEERVADWSFSDEIQEVFIETRPWYGIPHSTTIWCVALDGGLYIGSYGEQKKAWEEIIERKPEARLSIAGRIYDVMVAPVTEGDLIEALDAAYARKYDMEEVFGQEIPVWRYYLVSQRGPHAMRSVEGSGAIANSDAGAHALLPAVGDHDKT
jgi:hypothetical protein